MISVQRSIYHDEMVKYPTLIVDITDLNKPHQYNEFNYKINRQLLKTCPKYKDQFSLLPLSKILDVEGIFSKQQYDSLERAIIEFIHLKKIDLLVLSIDDLYPYEDFKSYGYNQRVNLKIGKRYERGGIIILFSKKLNEIQIELSEKTSQYLSPADCNRLIEDSIKDLFNNKDYFKGIMNGIQAIKEKV